LRAGRGPGLGLGNGVCERWIGKDCKGERMLREDTTSLEERMEIVHW